MHWYLAVSLEIGFQFAVRHDHRDMDLVVCGGQCLRQFDNLSFSSSDI
jgi:hypothetical protein